MSMDQLNEEIEYFIRALDTFNEATAKNWDELHRAWASADELWQDDTTRKKFEKDWDELGTELKKYREQHGEKYLQFLLERKRALDKYFG